MSDAGQSSAVSGVLRRWWIVVLFAVLGGIVGAYPQPAEVAETATSFVATNTSLSTEGSENSGISPDQINLLSTVGEVPERVGDQLGLTENPAEIAAQVQVNYDFATGALTVSTEQSSAGQAELLADTYAQTINSYLVERQTNLYQEQLAASRQLLDELQEELDVASAEAAADPGNVTAQAERDAISREYGVAFEQNRQLEGQQTTPLSFTTLQSAQAVPVEDSGLGTPTSRTVRGIMGFIVGGVLGLAIAFLLSLLDRKARSRDQIEEMMGMRARVAIPLVRKTEGGVVVTEGRHDALSDAYRTVRNVVGFVQSTLPPVDRARVTLVVSPGPGDGKTSLSANLAAAFIETGERTVAINTDFRRPRMSQAITGMDPAPLPFDYLDLRAIDTTTLLHPTRRDNLKILDLASIDAAPGELVRATIPHLQALAEVSDEIVVDTSPVGATAEVLDLIPYADVIVITARVGHTNIRSIERTIAILRDIATAPLILVVGGVRQERNPYSGYTSREVNSTSKSLAWFDRFRGRGESSPKDVESVPETAHDDTSEVELQSTD
ncbi:hypothetical protein [Ilumatobacter nonamiensis]|uniref:hypothetical protein n=1 Tax=Ilumatobacter nonamiensis TaxID=467093 RepID=UPI00034D878F|nr:hypothetical protein [Ilumatobacter nonamiensis]